METTKFNFSDLEQYIHSVYGGNVNCLATKLRKLAIDYSRVNLVIEAYGSNYISGDSCEYLAILTAISDAIDKTIETKED